MFKTLKIGEIHKEPEQKANIDKINITPTKMCTPTRYHRREKQP